jgi:ubiquinone/menaquinone biosynthesis C-methylase UbiE
MTEMSHNDLLDEAFTRQAPRFLSGSLTLADPAHLDWMVERIDPCVGSLVLDAGAGTGHLGLALAPRVGHVVALDRTAAMLNAGRAVSSNRQIDNMSFHRGDMTALPYKDDSFDCVVTRFTLHHLLDPAAAVLEMTRVCRPSGKIAVVDLTTPSDPAAAREHNRLERLRDPSHVRALGIPEIGETLARCGLRVIRYAERDVEVDLVSWLDLTGTTGECRSEIERELRAEVDRSRSTCMRPYLNDERIKFLQTWVIFVAGQQ